MVWYSYLFKNCLHFVVIHTVKGFCVANEEEISEMEDKMVEITSEVQNKVKRMKRNEDSIRDLCNNIKRTNIQIIWVPEEEKKSMRKILKRL